MKNKVQNLSHQEEIINIIDYFAFFSYPPSFEEIYKFFPEIIGRKKLKRELEIALKKKSLLSFKQRRGVELYTYPQYKKLFKLRQRRKIISSKKIQKTKFFLWLASQFPQIKFIGFSGTVAMNNADEKDDIDLFIITAGNRLFTARFIALLLAHLLGIRRRRGLTDCMNKVCLNLLFEENNLKIPKHKQNDYVGHEVLQLKPVINKNRIYEKFLAANRWVYKLFPNAEKATLKSKVQSQKLQSKSQSYLKNFKALMAVIKFLILTLDLLADKIEAILKKIQLFFIRRHQTNEIITDTQLWFHPKDFGKQIQLYGFSRD